MVSWCKCEKKSGTKYMLKFYSGWINIRQNKCDAMIIFLYFILFFVLISPLHNTRTNDLLTLAIL